MDQMLEKLRELAQENNELKSNRVDHDGPVVEMLSDIMGRLEHLEKKRLGLTPDELWEVYGLYIKKCRDGWLPMKGSLCYQPNQGWVRGERPIHMWPTYAAALADVIAYQEGKLPMNVMAHTNEVMVGKRTLSASKG